MGATRSTTGAIPTDKLFTGQQQEPGDSLGLYNYGARFYSTALGRFVSADPIAKDGLNRYTYVLNNPTNAVDPTGLYLLAVCGWSQNCNNGLKGFGDWRNTVIQYWKSTGRFGDAKLDDVFNLFQGAKWKHFADAQLISIFDADVVDSSNLTRETDVSGSARMLSGFIGAIPDNVTYLAGFSFGGATINEYLYGVSRGMFSASHLDLRGVYFVGAPNVHKLNTDYNLWASGGTCGFNCDYDSAFQTIGGSGDFNVAQHFSARVIARSAPAEVDLLGLNVSLTEEDEIHGGAQGGDRHQNRSECGHCIGEMSSWWDARDLFGLTD